MDFSKVIGEAFWEIFQSMSEGIIMVDESGEIISVNPAAEMMFGYKIDEFRSLTLENLLPQRYRGGHLLKRNNYMVHPEPRKMGIGRDLAALRKDGTEFPVEISLNYTK
ncbi:MAG: PAS domain S-box protein, partial [Cyclobacteriaceae bacterium]|nr:PAS domain S-box protein [Cyclobacteriaceae bacterium]